MNFAFDYILETQVLWSLITALVALRFFQKVKNTYSNILFAMAVFVLILIAINPLKSTGDKKPLPGIVAIILDETPSMKVTKRTKAAAQTIDALAKKLKQSGFIVKVSSLSENDKQLSIASKLDDVTRGDNLKQISGAVIISDGLLPDSDLTKIKYPINQLIVGSKSEYDRHIKLIKPAIAAEIGKTAEVIIKVQDNQIKSGDAEIEIKFGAQTIQKRIEINQDITLQIPIEKSGKQEIAISTPVMNGEISGVNNTIIAEIEGIFDRLRVLLISGEPYEGLRSWRALLKSDPSIDLVHFTILRGPEKEDYVPQNEISLIPFPVEELFYEKLDSFDLVIIDRFMAQDVLREEYLENINAYVENGGALLAVFGAFDTNQNGLMGSKLAQIMPLKAIPTLETKPFVPNVANNAKNHPIVRGLETTNPWGKWDTYYKAQTEAETILKANEDPLLVLKNIEEGRVAVLLSENSWFWARNIDGGGPFRELIGRTIHYLLKDPQFEKQKLELNDGLESIGVRTQGIKGKLAINGPLYSSSIEIADENGEQNTDIFPQNYGLYQTSLDGLIDYAIFGAHSETIGQELAARTFESPHIWGSKAFTNDYDFQNMKIQIFGSKPLRGEANELVFLKPSLSSESIERRPLMDRNLLLLLAIILLYLSWYLEGFSLRRIDTQQTN